MARNLVMADGDVLQVRTCLKLLPDSAAAAAELAFIQGVERLQDYGIILPPTELFKVRLTPHLWYCMSGFAL